MKSPAEILRDMKRGPTDVVGLDVDSDSVRAVRMRKNNEGLTLLAAEIIKRPSKDTDDDAETLTEIPFSSAIKAHYGSLALDSGPAVIRLLTLPGKDDTDLDDRVIDNLGLENPDDFRISYTLLDDSTGSRTETRIVAVAYPDDLAASSLALLPSTGTPAPYSIEVAGLATMTAFMNGPVPAREKETLGLIDFGETSTLFAFFHKGVPVLIRKLDRGTHALLDKVEATLGVNRETASGIIADGSFDISEVTAEVMQPLVRQLLVSRDFVERRENCNVDAIFLAGGLAASRDTHNEIHNAMQIPVETWDPFAGISMGADAIPEELKGQAWRFSAAVGACMATFEV